MSGCWGYWWDTHLKLKPQQHDQQQEHATNDSAQKRDQAITDTEIRAEVLLHKVRDNETEERDELATPYACSAADVVLRTHPTLP